MAYIPPHKRHHNKEDDRSAPTPSPIPASLNPRFKETLNLGSNRRRQDRHGSRKIVFAADSIFRWWPVGAASDGDPIPASFRLEPFDWEIMERRNGEKPLVIVGGGGLGESGGGEVQDMAPWVSIAEKVVPDLFAAAVSARDELNNGGDEETKLYFLAKPGKNVFHGGSSVSLDSIKKAASKPINYANKLRKIFSTNVPHSYMENAQITVAPKIGLSFHSEKDRYHIVISDKHRPDLTITCKCAITESGQLKLYKIEEHIVRHMVADISCLYKKFDLRLFLFTRRKMKTIDNDENEALNKIVTCAIIDPDVKGGLRWTMGKQSSGERFSVVGAWHTKSIALRNDKMRLALRHADRFDFLDSTGEVSSELSLKLIEISRLLKLVCAVHQPISVLKTLVGRRYGKEAAGSDGSRGSQAVLGSSFNKLKVCSDELENCNERYC